MISRSWHLGLLGWAPLCLVFLLFALTAGLRSDNARLSELITQRIAVNTEFANKLSQNERQVFAGFHVSTYWIDGEKASAAQLFQEAVLRELDRFNLILSSQREASTNPEIAFPHTNVRLEFEGDLGRSLEFIDSLAKHEPPMLVDSLRVARLSDFEQIDGQTRVRISMTVWGVIATHGEAS